MDDLPLLREMLREAERGIDQQLRTLAEVDDKSEQILTVAIAVAGGGLALVAWSHDKVAPAELALFRVLFLAGFALNLGACVVFLSGYLGIVTPLAPQAAPSLGWLASKAEDATWGEREHLGSLILAHANSFASNERLFQRARRANLVGFALLILAVTAYLGSALYVL